MRKTTLSLAAAVAVAAAPAAQADAPRPPQPRLAGSPIASFALVKADGGRYVSIGAVFKLRHPQDRGRYAVAVAPSLRTGQRLPDALFGGSSIGRLGTKGCFSAEAVQLRKRRSVKAGARWKIALVRGSTVVGPVKSVTLRRGTDPAAASGELGC